MEKGFSIQYMLLLFTTLAICTSLYSQDEGSSTWTTGADISSSYIWRGTRLGNGPSVQPLLEFNSGSLTAGGWGCFDFRGYQETDLYFSFATATGFSVGLTDYYSPDLKYFDYSGKSGSHAFELNLRYSINNIDLSANYVLNEAGGIGSVGKDLYFEAGYSFKSLSLFIGAGNGWLTYDPEADTNSFNICNIGIEVPKTIKVSDTFEIPVSGQLIFNPDSESMYLFVVFTL